MDQVEHGFTNINKFSTKFYISILTPPPPLTPYIYSNSSSHFPHYSYSPTIFPLYVPLLKIFPDLKKERSAVITQMGFPWRPRNTPSTITAYGGGIGGSTTNSSSASNPNDGSSTSTQCCCCSLTKLVRKLKKHSRLLRMASRQSSRLKCRYDPLSYSLNFDTSGCGSLLDEDYYSRFYAFSSRFVANATTTSCPGLIVATSH